MWEKESICLWTDRQLTVQCDSWTRLKQALGHNVLSHKTGQIKKMYILLLLLLWMTLQCSRQTVQLVLLIVTFWSSRPWFYLLLRILMDSLCPLPIRKDLLSQAQQSPTPWPGLTPSEPRVLACLQGVRHTFMSIHALSFCQLYAHKCVFKNQLVAGTFSFSVEVGGMLTQWLPLLL